MLDLLILTLVIVVIIFLAPMIMGLIIFLLCVAAIVIMLAYFGFLPGFRYVRYVEDTRGSKLSRKWKWKYGGRADDFSRHSRGDSASHDETNRENAGGWYQTSQEGEEITLPETALRKENEKK